VSRSIRIAVAALAAAALSSTFCSLNASAATKAAGCTSNPYAYAGLIANSNGYGIRATITATRQATVRSGHVAGWIGVGSPNAGPNGEAEWLQAGLNAIADGRAEIYGELTLPSRSPIYKRLGEVEIGKPYRLAVLEVPGKPGTWQVWLNGKPVSKQVALPGSHGKFQPMAMTESWNGGTPSCNDFSYRFASVLVAGKPRSWARLTPTSAQTLTDIGYRVAPTTAGFVAGREI
jgi:hypothetical protein